MPASFRPTRIQPQIDRPVITGGPASNAGSAAGNVNLGNTFAALKKSGPRFDELAAEGIALRAQERAIATAIEGKVNAQGVQAYGQVKSDKLIADAQKQGARDEARGSMIGSAFGAIGSIGGLLLSGGIA